MSKNAPEQRGWVVTGDAQRSTGMFDECRPWAYVVSRAGRQMADEVTERTDVLRTPAAPPEDDREILVLVAWHVVRQESRPRHRLLVGGLPRAAASGP
ncbi:hypothetical protein ABZ912_25915 [Nonomuraea angiospora]|uniref:hypothetical protein n=1 Tax=Nonomuraea angiospora TaxID=46172 RepID=UPI0033F320DB